MLTRWLTFTAFLAGSANPERAVANGRGTVTVAPTCRVKGHPEAELPLNCGDGKKAGVVQYWHTPFGDLQTPGLPLDPVFMHWDGSLKVPNTSILHSGLYYCLLQHTEGTTLWPYELHVGHNEDPKNQGHSECKECDVFRFRRDVGSVEERQAGVSDGQFAGAVAASVLLTFVVGFSAGALTRTPLLRCLGAVTIRLRSPRQQRKTDSDVTMTTLPPINDSASCSTMDTTITPPTKPQRSFRQKRQEERETTAYLEGCDYMEEEEKEAGRSLKENNEGCNWEAEEGQYSGLYPSGEDAKSQTEDDKSSKDREEKDGRESREEKKECRQEEDEVEEAGKNENRSNEDVEDRRGSEEEKGRDEEDQETASDDDETGSNKQEDTMKNGAIEGETLLCPGRRRRVIRLYQYDEEGQRFGHLPSPATNEPGLAPRLKQRSLSLTRLNTIMAAASAGPLDTRDPGRGEREERPHFHVEI